jgi:hypothetical protein
VLLSAVWCRRTDELVDGPNANYITPTALDRWEKRLEDLFEGRPYDMLDAALSDTISRFPIDIQVVDRGNHSDLITWHLVPPFKKQILTLRPTQ